MPSCFLDTNIVHHGLSHSNLCINSKCIHRISASANDLFFFQRDLQYSSIVWLTAYYSGSISKCMLHRCQAAGCVKEAANATKCATIVTLT